MGSTYLPRVTRQLSVTHLLRVVSLLPALLLCATLTMRGQAVHHEAPSAPLSASLTRAIDSLYRDYAVRNNLPGIAYGIITDGTLTHSGAYGWAQLPDSHTATTAMTVIPATATKSATTVTPATTAIAATPATAFRAASMTKSFTAMAILRLRDEGRLQLDDPVAVWIPELSQLKQLTGDAPVLTLRHLLTHSGGMPQDDPWADRKLDATADELTALLEAGITMSTVTGTAFEYSNLGYTLLGRVIEAVTGQSYQSYIESAIFRPLGMMSTTWEYDELPPGIMAQGYRFDGEGWVAEEILHDGVYGAMGGLITTVDDFARYAILHLRAWPPHNGNDEAPLKRNSVREMHMPHVGAGWYSKTLYAGGPECDVMIAYGYGLRWTLDCMGRRKLFHNGGLPGYGGNWTIMPDYQTGVVAFSNRTYGSTYTINQQVLEMLLDKGGVTPYRPEPPEILKRRKDELLKLLPGWGEEAEGDEDLFADNFFYDNPVNELRLKSAKAFEQAGNIITVSDIIPENNLRGTFMIEGDRGTLRVSFTLTPEPQPRIQSFTITSSKK